jgi:hypothetical protein
VVDGKDLRFRVRPRLSQLGREVPSHWRILQGPKCRISPIRLRLCRERTPTPAVNSVTGVASGCAICDLGPCAEVVIRRHVGMIFVQRFYKVKPTVCRAHGIQLWKKWTGLTILQGWWGYISFFANIFAILMNLVALAKLLRLPASSSAYASEPGS